MSGTGRDMTALRIGDLASKGTVNLETGRYYEREVRMRVPQGIRRGHRAYAPGDVLPAVHRGGAPYRSENQPSASHRAHTPQDEGVLGRTVRRERVSDFRLLGFGAPS